MHSVLSVNRQNGPYILKDEFKNLSWLPVKNRFHQSINSIVLKFFNNQCPSYLKEVFEFVLFVKLTQDKTCFFALTPQHGIKPQRFSKNQQHYYLPQLK